MTCDLTPYPDGTIYIVHRLFHGEPFEPGGAWGDIGDGPLESFEAVMSVVLDSFSRFGETPCQETLRVWCLKPDGGCQDITAGVLQSWAERMQPTEAEPAPSMAEAALDRWASRGHPRGGE